MAGRLGRRPKRQPHRSSAPAPLQARLRAAEDLAGMLGFGPVWPVTWRDAVRTSHRLSLAAAAGALLAACLNTPAAAFAAPRAVMPVTAHATSAARHAHAPERAGLATGTPRSVNLRRLAQ